MAAKLLHSSLLCREISLKTLISLIPDYEDQDHVLITSKSFIKRFNVSNLSDSLYHTEMEFFFIAIK